MTIRELIPTLTSDLWITAGEDPNCESPDIIYRGGSDVDIDATDALSDRVLDASVHLMVARSDAVFVSLNWRNR